MEGPTLIVLVSSVSKKVPLVTSVKKALDKTGLAFRLIGADADPQCVGRFFVDEFWHMPQLFELTGKDFVSHCRDLGVNRVIPTRDGELLFYAENRAYFESEGIQVMVSEPQSVQNCLDKLLFSDFLTKKGFFPIPTALKCEDLEGDSFVVKERYGAASENIGLNLSAMEAGELSKTLRAPIFQPFIKGQEVSVDLYVDKNAEVKGVIARKRELVIRGESKITTSFKDKVLEEMCSEIALSLNLFGHVMFQLIYEETSNTYRVLECNPRFGGASTLSLAMGLDSFYWFFLEAEGKNLSDQFFHRSHEEKTLVRYPEDLILL